MEYEEYMQSLTEQIHNKRAKKLVEKEIRNHIEEQAEEYESGGMEHRAALREAVRQMGNPVDTGMALNKIHRPKMPWGMLALAMFLMLVSIGMQAVVFYQMTIQQGESAWAFHLPRTIGFNLIGFAVIIGLLYVDYNFIAKYAYLLYGIYLLLLFPANMMIYVLSYRMAGYYGQQICAYALLMLYPIIFAGIIYRNRNRGIRGMVISLLYSAGAFVCYGISSGLFGMNGISFPGIFETGMIVLFLLVAAVAKGIFGAERKKYFACLGAAAVAAAGFGLLYLTVIAPIGAYYMARLQNFFGIAGEDESFYIVGRLRENIAESTLLGNGSFGAGMPLNEDTYRIFLLNGIFSWFGKIAGSLTVLALAAFVVLALRTAIRQTNRIGYLVGMACGLGILVRVVLYLGMNFGYSLWWTTLVPFFCYGGIGAVMNGIYIGLLFCVHRNSMVLAEDGVKQRIAGKALNI